MKSVNNFSVFFQFFFFSLHSFLHEMSFGKKGVSSWCYMACLFYHSGAEEAPFVMNEFIQEQCWGLHPSRNVSTFDTFVDCIDLYYIFRWMGRAGSVHTGSLWTQMILNLRTNTMAVLIITATLGAKNTVTLSTQKFLFGAFVPFWDIFRYVCLDKIIHIFQTQMYLCLWMKNIVYFSHSHTSVWK